MHVIDVGGSMWAVDSNERIRLAENEAMFRDVNETLADAADSQPVTFLCECADEFCAESLSLSRAEYEAVRAFSERFAVAPGHVLPEVETVVDRHHRFWVVEKRGQAGVIAEETDPRADR